MYCLQQPWGLNQEFIAAANDHSSVFQPRRAITPGTCQWPSDAPSSQRGLSNPCHVWQNWDWLCLASLWVYHATFSQPSNEAPASASPPASMSVASLHRKQRRITRGSIITQLLHPACKKVQSNCLLSVNLSRPVAASQLKKLGLRKSASETHH